MYELDKIKKEIAEAINKALETEIVEAHELSTPPNHEMGDLSYPCFSAAREIGKNPAEVAGNLVKNLVKPEVVAGISAMGPYLNFTFKEEILAAGVIGDIQRQKDKYGINKSGDNKAVMIEYSNGNTHKECHIGHVRNICYGDAVHRLQIANGFKSIPVSYINDFGIHVAKTIWWTFHRDNKEGKKIDKGKIENKGQFLGQMYAAASQREKEDPTAKPLIQLTMKKIESRDSQEYKLWQGTRQWTIDQLENIYKDLGIKFKKTYYESDMVDIGRKRVNELIKKGILKESQGAVIADLEEYGLGVLVILRSDGTALYPVADIALNEKKFKDFKLDASVYVVDIRQAQYFKQLFKVIGLLGHKQTMIHLGYDFVKLPSGMMSSRTGNIITYEDLKEEVMKRAIKETKERHKDWSEEQMGKTAEVIGYGAMKFEMLKVGAKQEITFDIDKALAFQGYTAAYLQYTYARICSIERKAGDNLDKGKADFKNLSEAIERELVMKLAQYPNAVKQAGKDFDPSEITKYLFDLAQNFNDYYHKVPILKAEVEVCRARLALIASVKKVLENGLDLLGINIVEEM